jgi:hypothetical protein
MTTATWRGLVLAIVALAPPPVFAVAGPLDDLHEVALDIDNDGKMDRAALVRHPENRRIDLYIYSGLGDDKLDLTRKPTVLKQAIATNLVLALESRAKGSLIVSYGCGGCSNDWAATLTIAHRSGNFVVAGYTLDWDTRNGAGKCDVNFLTGKGTLQRGSAKAKPLRGKFASIKLADWSEEKRPKACE